MKTFVRKYKYCIYTICIIANIYGTLKLHPSSLFAIGWCTALLFAELINDEKF